MNTPSWRPKLMPLIGALFLAVGLLVGGALLIGAQSGDYSAHTSRATATVTDIETVVRRDSSGRTRTDRTYFVDYTAEGQTFRRQQVQGSVPASPGLGGTVELAYPPGDAGDTITVFRASGQERRVLTLVGAGVVLVFGGLGATLLVLHFRGRSRTRSGTPPAEPVLPSDEDPATLPVPWPREELAGQLATAAQDTPYTVEHRGDEIVVRLDLADARWYSLMYRHGLKQAFEVMLRPDASAPLLSRTDTMFRLEWRAGSDPDEMVPRLSGAAAVTAGRVWSRQRRVEYGVGRGGRPGRIADIDFSTAELNAWLFDVLGHSGWRTRLGAATRFGIAGAAVGALVAVVVVVMVLIGT